MVGRPLSVAQLPNIKLPPVQHKSMEPAAAGPYLQAALSVIQTLEREVRGGAHTHWEWG
jgi:hypothetical protein